MTKLLNIATLGVAPIAALHVKSAGGEPLYLDEARTLPVRIHLYGPGSDQAGIVESRATARGLKRMDDNDGKITAATPEERKAEIAADLTTLTSHFENFNFQPEGADAPLTGEALCQAVYGNPLFGYMTKQAQKHFSSWGNFSAVSTGA